MIDVELIFIGTGDAANTGGRANQSILLRAGAKNILLDCGPTTLYRMRLMGLPLNAIDAVLFTHFHGDHFVGIVGLDLASTIEEQRTREIVYAGARGIEGQFVGLYRLCYPGFYPNDRFERRFQELDPGCSYNLCDCRVFPVAVDHSPSSLGYRIEVGGKTLAVSGDTAWCDGLIELANGVDLFVCECSHYREVPKNQKHLSYRAIRENREMLKSPWIVVVHAGAEVLEHRDSLLIEVAEDGTRISL